MEVRQPESLQVNSGKCLCTSTDVCAMRNVCKQFAAVAATSMPSVLSEPLAGSAPAFASEPSTSLSLCSEAGSSWKEANIASASTRASCISGPMRSARAPTTSSTQMAGPPCLVDRSDFDLLALGTRSSQSTSASAFGAAGKSQKKYLSSSRSVPAPWRRPPLQTPHRSWCL